MKIMVYLPMAMVIASNVIYHNVSKNTPADANPMLSLAGTYLVSFICCVVIYLVLMPHDFQTDLRHLNWSTWVLGVAIIGLEAGYLLIYRAGWAVSRASLIANICVAVVLAVIGVLFYKEQLDLKQVAGIVFCLIGIGLLK
jgi:drug/metabolite transporter (DMT)-like permease